MIAQATQPPFTVGIDSDGHLAIFADAQYRQPSQIAAGANASCVCRVAPPDCITSTDLVNAQIIKHACNSILPLSRRCDELEKALMQLVKAGDDCVMSASLAANSYGSHLVSAVANGRTLLSQIESEK